MSLDSQARTHPVSPNAVEPGESRNVGRPYLVHRCCRFIEDNLLEALALDDLCRVAGASPRTLEYAFREVLGSSPMAWYRSRRFAAARRVLGSRPPAASVTEVATRFSFWHLGRFSVEYRTRFGEPPSATLRRARSSA